MKCPSCGSEMPEESSSCPSCATAKEITVLPGPVHPGNVQVPAQTQSSTARMAQTQVEEDSPSPKLTGRIRPGTTLAGRYRIVEQVGRGGMGEVYRAEDLKLDQTVALKFLPDEVGQDPSLLARLFSEVRIARQVSHPNVCRVFDIGEADGQHFLSMEFIEGEDLATLLRRKGKLAKDEAIAIAHQLCAGLSAAHERGVVHRDLKPSNVMFDRRGVVRITDFGLADATKVIRGLRAREGTPLYMSPEQLAGRDVTAQSDIYALGLVLYEIFTGSKPFRAQTVEDLSGLRQNPPGSPSKLAPDIDRTVEHIILRCLESDPIRRPVSARIVASTLPGGDRLEAAQHAAQQRADRISAFRAELADLRGAGVLEMGEGELSALEKYHAGILRDLVETFDVDTSDRGKQLSLGMRMVSLFGALAFGASAFYSFYRIWGVISFPVQLAILISSPIIALLASSLIGKKERFGYFTSIAAFFAFACLILNVTVLAAILNLEPSPMGFLSFGLFAIILALAFRVRLLYATGLVLLAILCACLTVAAFGADWVFLLSRPESLVPTGVVILVETALFSRRLHPDFTMIGRSIGLVLLIGPTLILAMAGQLSALPFGHRAIEIGYQLAGFTCICLAFYFGILRRKKDAIYVSSALFVTLLFLVFVDWCWDWMPKYLFFLIVAVASVGAVMALKRLRAAVTSLSAEVAS